MSEVTVPSEGRYKLLAPDQRSIFKESISPHSEKARGAKQILDKFQNLDKA